MFYVYILQNPAGKFYVGQTDNLDRRIAQHNSPEPHTRKYTQKNGPWQLVYKEPHPTRSAAMQREKQIKTKKSAAWIRKYLIDGADRKVPVNSPLINPARS